MLPIAVGLEVGTDSVWLDCTGLLESSRLANFGYFLDHGLPVQCGRKHQIGAGLGVHEVVFDLAVAVASTLVYFSRSPALGVFDIPRACTLDMVV